MTSLMGLAHGKGKGHAASTPNLIRNGSFVGHADGWYAADGNTSAAYAGGALTATAPSGGGPRLVYRPGGVRGISLGGLTEIDVVGMATYASGLSDSCNLAWWLYFDTSPQTASGLPAIHAADPPTPVPDGEGPTAFGARGIAVPDGMTHVLAFLVANAQAGALMTFDDLYLGPVGGDAPPYPAIAVPGLPANRLLNGDFETGITDWDIQWGGEVLTHDTATPLTGIGSLAVTTPGDFDGEGIRNDIWWGAVVIAGETLRVRATLAGNGAQKVGIQYDGGSFPEVVWSGTLTGTPTVIDEEVVVPAAGYAQLFVITDGAQATAYRVDGVSLGTP